MGETSSRATPSLGAIQYARRGLDRAAHLREDAEALDRAMAAPDAALIPVWRNRNLLRSTERPEAVRCETALAESASETVFLGLDGRTPVFAADFSELDEQRATALTGGAFADLRRFGPALDPFDASLLAYARGMLYWHRNHRHCGRCGAPTESSSAGHLRTCSNPDCDRTTFPRTDPAMIVLVRHPTEAKCLLGRTARFPAGVYSTLAGFVEPGESLEQTVRREVFEESGVEIGDVDYLGSQPWPFPSSLMVGFHARARTTEIRRHDDELEDARWFTADELRAAGEWGGDEPLCLPRRDSIARALIQAWLDGLG